MSSVQNMRAKWETRTPTVQTGVVGGSAIGPRSAMKGGGLGSPEGANTSPKRSVRFGGAVEFEEEEPPGAPEMPRAVSVNSSPERRHGRSVSTASVLSSSGTIVSPPPPTSSVRAAALRFQQEQEKLRQEKESRPAPGPHKRASSVMDRVKMFKSMEEQEEEEVSGHEKKDNARRLSLLRLQAGAVSGLRERLFESGFDPSITPDHIEDMIDRGENGLIKNEDDSDDDDDNDDDDSGDDDGSASDEERESDLQRAGTPLARTPCKPASRGAKKRAAAKAESAAAEAATAVVKRPQLMQFTFSAKEHAAALRLQSLAHVMISRGLVRRKLVSEVTAFSIIMERGIELTKHHFGSRGKPKLVTVAILNKKKELHLCWGSRSSVPLSAVYGVVRGRQTTALKRSAPSSASDCCFSLLLPKRTLDFQSNNPWLTMLIVRAMRLYLGAHFNTLPAPRFFSPLCIRPNGTERTSLALDKTAKVWTLNEDLNNTLPRAEPPQIHVGDEIDGASFALSPYSVASAATLSPRVVENDEEGDEDEESDVQLPLPPMPSSPPMRSAHARAVSDASALKGKRFDFMALPSSPSSGDERGHQRVNSNESLMSGDRTKNWKLSFGIAVAYKKHEENEDMAADYAINDLNDKLDTLRKLVGHGGTPKDVDAGAFSTSLRRNSNFFQQAFGVGNPSPSKATAPTVPPASRPRLSSNDSELTDVVSIASRPGEMDAEALAERERKKMAMFISRASVHRAIGNGAINSP
jgi:hypothetical protein